MNPEFGGVRNERKASSACRSGVNGCLAVPVRASYDQFEPRIGIAGTSACAGSSEAERATFKVGAAGVAVKPRLLVIDRDSTPGKSILDGLSEAHERVTVRTISKALALLRDQKFDAVYVDASQLSAVRWVGMMIQAEEILDAISDGVAVVDPDLRIIWANPEFHLLTDSATHVVGCPFYQALGQPEILGPDPCPFTSAVASKAAASTGREDRREPLSPAHGDASL